jgi:hypothetical protein
MGSASISALSAAAAAALLVVSSPVSSPASILPQIKDANATEAQQEAPVLVPALRKHFVEVSPGIYVAVKGERERRQVRFARLLKSLSGDRLEVYEREGFPTFRHRELEAGIRTEHWTYAGENVTYVFRGDRLVSVVPF